MDKTLPPTAKDKDSDKITVWKDVYKQLVWDSQFLEALEVEGVDNWEGYANAYTKMVDSDEIEWGEFR